MAIMVPPIYDYNCEFSSFLSQDNKTYIMEIIHWIDEIEDEEHDPGEDQEKIEQIRDTFKKLQIPRNLDLLFHNIGTMLFQFGQVRFFR